MATMPRQSDPETAPVSKRPFEPYETGSDPLRQDHFRKLAREIEAAVGIRLPPSKKSMVEGRLRRRARATGLDSLAAYGTKLFEDGWFDQEFGAIVDCVTTNKTDFFREPEHFALLTRLVVPTLLKARSRPDETIKLWSAACSTGAEAYTLAMVLAAFQARASFSFSILATDISTRVLETAVRAVYPEEFGEPIPPEFREAYTMAAIDAERREFRVVPELRNRVAFLRHNLMNDTSEIKRDFHVIFCRNVLIYFDKVVQREVVGRLVRHLRPGGYIVLGHSEATVGADQPGLRPVAPTLFQHNGGTA